MAAPKGNKFWQARTKHGRDRIFADPEALWEACHEYFVWVEENPLWEHKVAQFQGVPVSMEVPKLRAMTIGGLCIFLGIDRTTWVDWRKHEDFSRIVAHVEAVIYEQKFTGAAADLLNSSIIARDLGLAEKSEHDHKSTDGSMTPAQTIDPTKLSTEALQEIVRARLKPDAGRPAGM